MTVKLLGRLWFHLSPKRRRQFFLVLGLTMLSALAEMLSLGAVLPFLGVLTAPQRVLDNANFASIASHLGIQTQQQLLLPVTLAFAIVAVAAAALRIGLLWASSRLAYASGSDISADIYRKTLYQPYRIHLMRNSSEIISGITNKVAASVSVLGQVLFLVSASVLAVAISVALILIDTYAALISALVFALAYVLIAAYSAPKLRRNSQLISHEQTRVVRTLQEGLGAIRDVLLDGTQRAYCAEFHAASSRLRTAQASNMFLSGSPRYALECLGMVLISLLAYSLTLKPGGIGGALPVLGALALGAQRLMPTLQQAYNAWATIRGNQSALGGTVDLLDQPLPGEVLLPPPEPLTFDRAIEMDNVRYRYGSDSPWVLDNLSLRIQRGAKVAFVGSTGSGKSTILDLLMALIEPTEGSVKVDGKELVSVRVAAWQRAIAHVPQSIYLADASIAENIALGVASGVVDMERVRVAASRAQCAEFISAQPLGYDTIVGERGVRLSGGQRQRIGIARALYKNASVLFFDEATSALDNATESQLLSAIRQHEPDLTIIMIAHRLSTVRECDSIFEISKGNIVAQGKYAELLESSLSFRQLAFASN